MKNYGRALLLALLAALAVFAAVPCMAAEAKITDFGYSERYSRSYKNIDVTGDGKANTISIGLGKQISGGFYGRLVIRIDGKTAFTKNYDVEGTFGSTVKVVTLQNGATYVYICDNLIDEGNSVCGLFQYDGSKLVQKYDFLTMNGKLIPSSRTPMFSNIWGTPTAVSGNKIQFEEVFRCAALSGTRTVFTLSYSGGNLKLASSYGKVIMCSGRPTTKAYVLAGNALAYPTATAPKYGRKFAKGGKLRVTSIVITANQGIRFRGVNSKGRFGFFSIHACFNSGGRRRPMFEGFEYGS